MRNLHNLLGFQDRRGALRHSKSADLWYVDLVVALGLAWAPKFPEKDELLATVSPPASRVTYDSPQPHSFLDEASAERAAQLFPMNMMRDFSKRDERFIDHTETPPPLRASLIRYQKRRSPTPSKKGL